MKYNLNEITKEINNIILEKKDKNYKKINIKNIFKRNLYKNLKKKFICQKCFKKSHKIYCFKCLNKIDGIKL